MTFIPSLTFTELWVVSMEHLQRVWLASSERLPFLTPGFVPLFGTCFFQFLRPDSSNLPCLYSTFRLEYTLVLSRFCFAASQAGDADSSRSPGHTSGLQGSVNVHRGAQLLVPQWQCISYFVFYINDAWFNSVLTFAKCMLVLNASITPGKLQRSKFRTT